MERRLREAFPEVRYAFTGLDLTDLHLKNLERISNGRIRTKHASFYDPYFEGQVDCLCSSDGLHWQPPIKCSELYYGHMTGNERNEYEKIALEGFNRAVQNIFKALAPGGMAVLQFARKGQLHNLYNLVRDVLDTPDFSSYQEAIRIPVFYPSETQIHETFLKAGFLKHKLSVECLELDLAFEKSGDVANYFRSFTETQIRNAMGANGLERFFSKLKKEASSWGVQELKYGQWFPTFVTARK